MTAGRDVKSVAIDHICMILTGLHHSCFVLRQVNLYRDANALKYGNAWKITAPGTIKHIVASPQSIVGDGKWFKDLIGATRGMPEYHDRDIGTYPLLQEDWGAEVNWNIRIARYF